MAKRCDAAPFTPVESGVKSCRTLL